MAKVNKYQQYFLMNTPNEANGKITVDLNRKTNSYKI